MFTRRFALGLLLAALILPVFAQEPNGVIFLLRDSDRGTDYKQGDIVEVFSSDVPVNLPPASPFWLVRVEGITLSEAKALMASEYNPDGSISKKRLWQIRTAKIPRTYQQFFLANRFLGFGTEPYISQFSATYPAILNDVVLQWADVRTWIFNKTTNKSA